MASRGTVAVLRPAKSSQTIVTCPPGTPGSVAESVPAGRPWLMASRGVVFRSPEVVWLPPSLRTRAALNWLPPSEETTSLMALGLKLVMPVGLASMVSQAM